MTFRRLPSRDRRNRLDCLERRWLSAALALTAPLLFARPASALQPVTAFLEHAKTWNPQNRAAHATVAQRDAELSISTGQLLPNLQVNGIYTRNEYEVTTASLIPPAAASTASPTTGYPNIVIQPLNQLDANATLTVPIINIANWDRRDAAKATLAGAQAEEANTEVTIEKNVMRDYFTLLGNEAVLLSANSNLEIARHNLKLAHDRRDSGTGSELDVQRAVADQSKAEQNVTAAQLNVTNIRRELYSLSGLVAESTTTFPEDDLHEEEPLATWSGKAGGVPSVRSAEASRLVAEKNLSTIKASVLPTLSADAEEKLTNATAFVGGHTSIYLLQLVANWKLDTTIPAQNRAYSAAASAARANEEHARQVADDAVFRDWQQIRSDIESARSARAQVAAAKLAASLAQDRYENGVATQLDVLQARQDEFSADVARIQADADLAYARLALRLDAGQLAKETR